MSFHSPQKNKPDWYSGLNGLAKVLGWKDIANSADRHEKAAAVRPVVPAPSQFGAPMEVLQIPGQIPAEVVSDETKLLQHLGYTEAEISEAQSHQIPKGGEPAARALLEEFASTKNWNKVAGDFMAYMMVGCISAREIFWNASEMPNFREVAENLLWRDFHRLHNEAENEGAMLSKPTDQDEVMALKEQIQAMAKQIEGLRQHA